MLTSSAIKATVEGLIVRRLACPTGYSDCGVLIKGGGLRLQACDVSSEGGDPSIASCMCVRGALVVTRPIRAAGLTACTVTYSLD